MGMFDSDVSSRTMRYRSGYSCSVTGFDRVVATAILAENQYMARLKPRPMIRPIHSPFEPPQISSPTTTKRAPRAAMSTQVLTLFTFISSFGPFTGPRCEKDLRHQGEGLAGDASPPA